MIMIIMIIVIIVIMMITEVENVRTPYCCQVRNQLFIKKQIPPTCRYNFLLRIALMLPVREYLECTDFPGTQAYVNSEPPYC